MRVHLKHSTFSWLNDVGYDPYNSAARIMRTNDVLCFFHHCW